MFVSKTLCCQLFASFGSVAGRENPRPRLQNFQGKSSYMKFHKLRVPLLTVTRSVYYYWLAIAREKKKSDSVTSVRPVEDTPFALLDSPFAGRCVIFKGMYVSCGR